LLSIKLLSTFTNSFLVVTFVLRGRGILMLVKRVIGCGMFRVEVLSSGQVWLLNLN